MRKEKGPEAAVSIEQLKKLKIWVRAKDFSLKIYRDILPSLPAEEKWNLGQQLRRSSVSIPANIVEGIGRLYYQDNARFCHNARRPLEETLSRIAIVFELGYIPDTLYAELEREGEETGKMLNGCTAFLKKSKPDLNEPGAGCSIREDKLPGNTPGSEDLQDIEGTMLHSSNLKSSNLYSSNL